MHDDVVCLCADDVARAAVELEIDFRDERAVFVAGGDEATVDLACIGTMRMATDDQVHRLVELLDDIDDGTGNARTFIVVAGGKAAFVDQNHNGLDALGLEFGYQRIHCFGLIAKFEAGNARRGDEIGRALERQADEGDGDAFEISDLVRREQRLASLRVDGAGGKIAERRALEGMRPLATVDGMAAAVLHAQKFLAAFVEFVIADGCDLQSHHGQRLDGRFVMKQCGEKWTCADQIAGGDKGGVLLFRTQLLHQRCHMLGAARWNGDLLRPVGGVVDNDAAGGGAQITVKVVDCEQRDIDRFGRCLGMGERRAEQRGSSEYRVESGHAVSFKAGMLRFLAREKRLERGNRLLRFHTLAEQVALLIDAAGEVFRR